MSLGRLAQLVNIESQPGFIASGILLMNKSIRCGLVQNLAGRFQLLERFFLVGFRTDVLECGPKTGAIGPISHPVVFGLFHPFFTGLMIRQGRSFQSIYVNKLARKYNRLIDFVNQ